MEFEVPFSLPNFGEGGSCGTHETGGVKVETTQVPFDIGLKLLGYFQDNMRRINPHPSASAPTLPQNWGREKWRPKRSKFPMRYSVQTRRRGTIFAFVFIAGASEAWHCGVIVWL